MRHVPFDPVPALVAIRPRAHRVSGLVLTSGHDEMRHGVLSRRGRRWRIDGCGRGDIECRSDGRRGYSRNVGHAGRVKVGIDRAGLG